MKQLLEQQWTHELWDRINQHNFGSLAANTSAAQFDVVRSMLEPIPNSNNPVLEKQKAAIVNMLNVAILSGAAIDELVAAVAGCDNIALLCPETATKTDYSDLVEDPAGDGQG